MESQLTVRVSEKLWAAVEARARRLQCKLSEVVPVDWEASLLKWPVAWKSADRIRHLLGSLNSKFPDLAERHREYVLESPRGER